MSRPFAEYIASGVLSQVLLLSLLWPSLAAAEGVAELRSGPGNLAGVGWAGIQVHYLREAAGERSWTIRVERLDTGGLLPGLDLVMRCSAFRLGDHGPDCDAAELRLEVDDFGVVELAPLVFRSGPLQHRELAWRGDAGSFQLQWSGAAVDLELSLDLDLVDLPALAARLPDDFGVDVLDGRVTARLGYRDGAFSGLLRWRDGALDALEGLVAAEAVDLELQFGLQPEQSLLQLAMHQRGGELLLGPVYLPAPADSLTLELESIFGGGEPGRIELRRFALNDPEGLAVVGSGSLVHSDQAWALQTVAVEDFRLRFPGFWTRWMEGPAASAGFGGLETRGEVAGRLDWQSGSLPHMELSVNALSLEDPRGRLALSGLHGDVDGEVGTVRAEIGWDSAMLWGLPLGASALSVYADEVGVRLLRPFTVPVFDGALGIDSLAWLNRPELPSRLVLDARIEPISLNVLTRELGMVELGGSLSGRLPGVQYEDERLMFAGGIAVDAFSGQILVDDLEIERPFGTLPALAAHVEFHRLDLLELTGAFDFGRMEGQVSGAVRDLRLLDWQPVAMDARLFTHEDAPRRRISQRAVDNLSSLGGAGGALLTGTVLRVFDDFPYRRAGLACRLSNNICHIDGVAPHDSGGFLIVEGRGLPRLDVVGHRRLVDWPQLLRQLQAIREQE